LAFPQMWNKIVKLIAENSKRVFFRDDYLHLFPLFFRDNQIYSRGSDDQ